MKVVISFMVLLSVILATLPSLLKGDGTLAGKIKTFFDYSFTACTVILMLMTVFMAVGVVSDDVRRKQIFMVMTKPLPRWQYILGRWLGVVLLNVIFLAAIGTAIYSISKYLRNGQPLNIADCNKVETEIFTARSSVSPRPIDIKPRVKAKLEQLTSSGRYDQMVQSYCQSEQMTESQARDRIEADIRKEETEASQIVGPGESLEWTFDGIAAYGNIIRGQGQVSAVSQKSSIVQIRATNELLGQLIQESTISVNGQQGIVCEIFENAFNVRYETDDWTRLQQSGVLVGEQVKLELEPIIQLAYKPQGVGVTEFGIKLYAKLYVLNPTDGTELPAIVFDAHNAVATIGVPARLVDKSGTLKVRYENLNVKSNPGAMIFGSVRIASSSVKILFRSSTYEANFVRGMLLMSCGVTFVAALGIFCGSFLSFGVGCMLAFLVFPFGMLRGFITEAISNLGYSAFETAAAKIGYYLLTAMKLFFPDISQTSPGGSLVDGMNISWSMLGMTALTAIGLQSSLLLLFSCLIFRRRELARVQV